jgi:hypothetical protein
VFIPKVIKEKQPTKEIANIIPEEMDNVIQSHPVPAVNSRKQLRDIKKKFGAHSEEYKSALKEMGQQRKSSMMSKT